MNAKPATAPKPPPSVAAAVGGWAGLIVRCALTALLVGGYYWVRGFIDEWYARSAGGEFDPATPRVIGVIVVLAALVVIWWRLLKNDPRFQAPLLVTTILVVGDAVFNILENHPAPPWLVEWTGGRVETYSPTIVAILVTILAELLLGRFFWGKWPHLASAYISGISVGILIKSPELWPFVLCGLISISSKYVLRVGGRHIWNPTNFGVTMMLLLAPAYVASLSVQAGNTVWAVIAIWLLGGLSMYRLRLFHIPLAFVAAFVPLAFVRSYVTGHHWMTELAPVTSPMFQLFIFFMITDPKTITRRRWSQVLVAVLVAGMETFLRLAFKDIYSLFHSLFLVGPAANLIEMYHDRRAKAAALATAAAAARATINQAPVTEGEVTGVLSKR